MDKAHPLETVKFIDRVFNNRYPVKVPDFMHHHWDRYETKRIASMESHLRHGDTLFEIGAESGFCSVIFSSFVGAENLCLFEPQPLVWANIKATFDVNGLTQPKAMFRGFASDKTVLSGVAGSGINYQWPLVSTEILEEMHFRGLKEFGAFADNSQITIDDFVKTTGIAPRGITMDVEGAETLVLRGCESTFREHKPLVWVSIHTNPPGQDPNEPGAITYDYGSSKEELLVFMDSCGYTGTFLDRDWEEHWFFEPNRS